MGNNNQALPFIIKNEELKKQDEEKRKSFVQGNVLYSNHEPYNAQCNNQFSGNQQYGNQNLYNSQYGLYTSQPQNGAVISNEAMYCNNSVSSVSVDDKISQHYEKSKIDFIKATAIDSHKTNNKGLVEKAKAKGYERKLQCKMEYELKKELSVRLVGRNPDKEICKFIKSSDGKSYKSYSILSNCHNLRLTIYIAYRNAKVEQVFHFVWDENPKGFKIPLSRISGMAMKKQLTIHGVQVGVGHDDTKTIQDMILAFLISEASVETIPFQYGWNMSSDGKWEFVAEKEKTIRGICNE